MPDQRYRTHNWVALGLLITFGSLLSIPSGQRQDKGLSKLVASDVATFDAFGGSISMCGFVAVIGTEGDDAPGMNSTGAAYIYRYDPMTAQWNQEAKLVASDAASWDEFGTAVAVDGDFAVVGANQIGNIGPGAAYVFRYDPDTGQWNEQVKLTASDAESKDEFGHAVAIDGDRIVVGAFRGDDFCPGNPNCDSGAAYVFRYDPDTSGWSEEAKLTASDAAFLDAFGNSVSISGDVIIIGAEYANDACPEDLFCNSGAAYIDRFDPKTEQWNEQTKLTADDAATKDIFGYVVSINEQGIAVICAAQFNNAGVGKAYVFQSDAKGESWHQQARLTASDALAGDQLGVSVTMAGDVIALGMRSPTLFGGTGFGATYLYQEPLGGWTNSTETAKLTPSDAQVNDSFGIAVSIDDGIALIGAFEDNDAGALSGSVYFFGGLSDCNTNGELDLCDIADGFSSDENNNGIPDECEPPPCPWDLDGSNDVGVKDLLILLGVWGPCPPKGDCSADFDGSGDVGVKDLLILLGVWGSCP